MSTAMLAQYRELPLEKITTVHTATHVVDYFIFSFSLLTALPSPRQANKRSSSSSYSSSSYSSSALPRYLVDFISFSVFIFLILQMGVDPNPPDPPSPVDANDVDVRNRRHRREQVEGAAQERGRPIFEHEADSDSDSQSDEEDDDESDEEIDEEDDEEDDEVGGGGGQDNEEGDDGGHDYDVEAGDEENFNQEGIDLREENAGPSGNCSNCNQPGHIASNCPSFGNK